MRKLMFSRSSRCLSLSLQSFRWYNSSGKRGTGSGVSYGFRGSRDRLRNVARRSRIPLSVCLTSCRKRKSHSLEKTCTPMVKSWIVYLTTFLSHYNQLHVYLIFTNTVYLLVKQEGPKKKFHRHPASRGDTTSLGRTVIDSPFTTTFNNLDPLMVIVWDATNPESLTSFRLANKSISYPQTITIFPRHSEEIAIEHNLNQFCRYT